MTNLLAKRFGTSPRLELLSGEWLKQGCKQLNKTYTNLPIYYYNR